MSPAMRCLMFIFLWMVGFAQLAWGQKAEFKSARVLVIDEVEISVQEAGILDKLEVRENSVIKAGQVLGNVEDSKPRGIMEKTRLEVVIAKEKAANEVNLKYAKKAAEVAKAHYDRAQSTNNIQPGTISQTELDEKRLEAERTELAIEQAEREGRLFELEYQLKQKELDVAQVDVERRQLLAPIDGTVVEKFKSPGEWVNPGDAVLRVLRLDRLRVEVLANAQQYGPDLQGKAVTLEVELTKGRFERYEGTVVFVSPEIEPVESTFRVWAEVLNHNRQLRPGLQGTLTIHLSTPSSTRPQSP